jgi:drug/metabolite transporter (DMT)-like permease
MKLLPVLGYLLCFGVSDCLWVYPNQKLPLIVSMTLRSIVTCMLFTILFLAAIYCSIITWQFNSKDVLTAIEISCISYGGLYCYVKSLNYEQVSIMAPITTILTSLIGVVLTILFYHEVLTLKILACLIAAFIGILLCFSRKQNTKAKINKEAIILCAVAAICWGISYTFFKSPINKLGVISFSLILESTILVINLMLLLADRNRKLILSLKPDKPTFSLLLIGVLIFCGTLLNSYSYKLFILLHLNILNKLGIIIPIAYGGLFLKERLSLIQISGICLLAIVSIIIIF